jgi:hypothetical protein
MTMKLDVTYRELCVLAMGLNHLWRISDYAKEGRDSYPLLLPDYSHDIDGVDMMGLMAKLDKRIGEVEATEACPWDDDV